MKLLKISKELSDALDKLNFTEPAEYVYNPLNYAWEPYSQYLSRYASSPKEVLMLGMNPGPWGMVQTGIPFGEIEAVRDWMKIDGHIGQPKQLHPKRPIYGWNCKKREVSGRRLWGWARKKFQTPERFFSRFFVANYCPLCFFDREGKNITPDKLKKEERPPLFQLCDDSFSIFIEELQPKVVIGIGNFAFKRLKEILKRFQSPPRLAKIIHPSPANPLANENWGEKLTQLLEYLGINLAK